MMTREPSGTLNFSRRPDGRCEGLSLRVWRVEFGATIRRLVHSRHEDVGVEQGRFWKWRCLGTPQVIKYRQNHRACSLARL